VEVAAAATTTNAEMKDMARTTIDVKEAMVVNVAKKEADTAEARDARNTVNAAMREADMVEERDVKNMVNVAKKAEVTEEEVVVKTMAPSAVTRVEDMEEAMVVKNTTDQAVGTQEVVMNDAMSLPATAIDQVVDMADRQAMVETPTKSRDVLKPSATIAVPVVAVEATVETSDDTKAVVDTMTVQVADMVEMTPTTTAHQEVLEAATLVMVATQVLMEDSSHLAHPMVADMVAQMSSRVLLNMLSPVVATPATPISSAWLLAC
jgi:hypothetical protein